MSPSGDLVGVAVADQLDGVAAAAAMPAMAWPMLPVPMMLMVPMAISFEVISCCDN